MFEFFIAFKYLIPRKRSLSLSLISLISFFVISLVVWLILVFLSVTTGIEKNWLDKLTSLNAPLRISPTKDYYSSYYYMSDLFSSSSGYAFKTIHEKAKAEILDPYKPDVDMEMPLRLVQKRENRDYVKEAYNILSEFKDIQFQDYEISGALLKLRQDFNDDKVSFLTQISYLASICDKNPKLEKLFIEPTNADLNSYLKKCKMQGDLSPFLRNITIKKFKTTKNWKMPLNLFPKNICFKANLIDKSTISISNNGKGWFYVKDKKAYFKREKETTRLNQNVSISTEVPLELEVKKGLNVKTTVQDIVLEGKISLDNVEIAEASAKKVPPLRGYVGIYLPKSMRDTGSLIGDIGYLSFTTQTGSSIQEQHIHVSVIGFYDPGVLPIGNRFLLVPQNVTSIINSSTVSFSPDGTPMNGIYVWFNDLRRADEIKKQLEEKFKKANISPYFNITTFKEYEFSKDMMQQFQSDKLLFSLIALIILIVACSNVISYLVLLVNDRKKEIASMQAMGAKKKSIVAIFGICGVVTGLASLLFGTIAALITLKHLNALVNFLSIIQGHSAFNAAFFGNELPNSLSIEALYFILIATPLVSLIAGLIPALKAAKMHPSEILRSE